LLLLQSNRMIFSCAVSFESKKKKIPDLSLPPCTVECTPFVSHLSLKQGHWTLLCIHAVRVLNKNNSYDKNEMSYLLVTTEKGVIFFSKL
jgi:hypothetical protein